MRLVHFAFLGVLGSAAVAPTTEIAPGVHMPQINLGTCACWSVLCDAALNNSRAILYSLANSFLTPFRLCSGSLGNGKPSDPSVGVPVWLAAGAVGIDCAFDYFNQAKVAAAVKPSGVPRSSIFYTTKVPGILSSLTIVQDDLKQLGLEQVDLVLLHMPLDVEAQWKGLEQALAQNLTRAIGISNFNSEQIEDLLKIATVVPAVNQCSMGVASHDDATIATCAKHNITYEAYGTMKGCNFSSPVISKIGTSHNKSAAQVCLRYIIDRDAVIAVGTGSSTDDAKMYTPEDLDIFDFQLSKDEMATLNAL